MDHDLAQADELIRRLGATYTEAHEALNATNGDLLAALAHLEQARAQSPADLSALLAELAARGATIAREGVIRRVRLKLGEATVREFAVSLTGLAAAAVVCAGVLLSQCTMEADGGPDSTE